MSLDIAAHDGKCQVLWKNRFHMLRRHREARFVDACEHCGYHGCRSNCLLRRITTCFLLLALAGIYAVPLAAAFAPTGMDCCVTGMCPHPAHSHARHNSPTREMSHQKMADCGMGSQAGSMRMCEMGACGSQRENVVRVAIFVLSAPVQIVHSPVQITVSAQPSEPAYSVSTIPDTPPPRTNLS